MKNKIKNKGFTILLSVLVTSIILSVGLGIFNIMTKELKLSGMGRESQIAFYAADAGIECFFFWEIKHPNLSDTAFNAPNTINCAGNSVANNFSGNVSNFTVPLSNNSCAKIKVTKSGLVTTVESRGYNTACDSTSPFKVERAIQLVSTKQEGGGMYVPPDPPTNLNIQSKSLSRIKLTWSNSCGSDSSCSYLLYRSTDGNIFSLAKSGITSSQYEDNGLLPSTLYYYYVTAVNSNGESDGSDTVSDTTKATTNSKTFAYNGTTGADGSVQSLTSSERGGATEMVVTAYGAQGGSNAPGNGLGGMVKAFVDVNSSKTLYIYVGGKGVAGLCNDYLLPSSGGLGGYNGGGKGGADRRAGEACAGAGGGGASDIRVDNNNNGTYELNERIVVVGGGGGQGSSGYSRGGGKGGPNEGNGANGYSDGSTSGGGGGSGASLSLPGSGGAGGTGSSGGGGGYVGTLGFGGSGSNGGNDGGGGGSGGGGGYYGGGGGGGGGSYDNFGQGSGGGGGGGGSNYISGTVITNTNGVRSGNGQIIIEW